MSCSEGHVLLLHSPDGAQWAHFLASRLGGPKYNIKSTTKDITTILQEIAYTESQVRAPAGANSEGANEIYENHSENKQNLSGKRVGDNNNNNNSNKNKDKGEGSSLPVSVNTSYSNTPRPAYSGVVPQRRRSIMDSLPELVAEGRLSVVVFLSPEMLDTPDIQPVDLMPHDPKRTVFLLIGVEITEVRTYFGSNYAQVFQSRFYVIDGSERSICGAMIEIIEAYEYTGSSICDEEEDDVYNVPPCAVQWNKVEKVFPQRLLEKERDVYILLSQPAEEEVFVIVDAATPLEIPLTCVCAQLYTFRMPDGIAGEVFFKVKCHGRTFSTESVEVFSELDLVRDILHREINPLTILAAALGLSTHDLGGVDTALAFRLQELAPAMTFASLFPCEDALNSAPSDDRSSTMWPSLLHFSAEYNLRTLCTELLRYPGMLSAACTENRAGDYPSQIAGRHGHSQLEADLLQFVDNQKRACDDLDSPLYVQHDPPKCKMMKPKSTGYVNAKPPIHHCAASSPEYMDMSEIQIKLPLIDSQHQHSETSLLKPGDQPIRSLSERGRDNVFESLSSMESDTDGCDYMNVTTAPNTVEPKIEIEPSRNRSWSSDASSPLDSPNTTARKALKMLGVGESDIIKSRTCTLDSSNISSTATKSSAALEVERYLSSTTPNTMRGMTGNQMYSDVRLTRRSHMTEKLKSFLSKIKGGKRSGSEGDITPSFDQNTRVSPTSNRPLPSSKIVPSARSSTNSGRSESKSGISRKNNLLSLESQERDSGSYSDDEKRDKTSPLPAKRQFKESNKPMTRRISQRAQQAKKERIENAPTLPSTGKKQESFKSFIVDY